MMAGLPQPGFLFSLAMMAVLLGVLVTVHEFGHYIVGRLFGVRVLTFSVGMGPQLFGWTDRRGTLWRVAALPIGGYCKFLGDIDASSRPDNEAHSLPAELKSQAFPFKPLWQRFLIVFAGPAINIIFAIALFWLLFMVYGAPPTKPVIGFVGSGSAAQILKVGDKVEEINGHKIKSFMQVAEIISQSPQQKLEFVVSRKGHLQSLSVVPGLHQEKDRWGNIYKCGELDIMQHIPAVAGRVIPNSAAEKAGFKSGDEIRQVNGQSLFGFADLRALVRANPGMPLRVLISRDGVDQVLRVTPGTKTYRTKNGPAETYGELGLEYKNPRVGPVAAIGEAAFECVHRVDQAATQLWRMITGRVALDEMGGMLRIGEAAGIAAAKGWDYFANLMALISITLAVMNLLPVPVLDGGHLALYAAEAVRGKPLNPKVLEVAFTAGFVLIVGLMLFLFWNDLRLFGVWRNIAGLWS